MVKCLKINTTCRVRQYYISASAEWTKHWFVQGLVKILVLFTGDSAPLAFFSSDAEHTRRRGNFLILTRRLTGSYIRTIFFGEYWRQVGKFVRLTIVYTFETAVPNKIIP